MREFVLGQFTLGLAHLLAGCSHVDHGGHDRSLLHFLSRRSAALRRTYFDPVGMRLAARVPPDPGGGGAGAPSPIRTPPTSRDTMEFFCCQFAGRPIDFSNFSNRRSQHCSSPCIADQRWCLPHVAPPSRRHCEAVHRRHPNQTFRDGRHIQWRHIRWPRDSPLERAFARKTITPKQYAAAQKYRHHGYFGGLHDHLGSLDLTRILPLDVLCRLWSIG